MEWLDNLYARFMAGENPETLYEEYRTHVQSEAFRARHTAVPRDTVTLMAAWEAKDWEAMAPWLTQDGDALTSHATRLLLDGWDSKDAQSQ